MRQNTAFRRQRHISNIGGHSSSQQAKSSVLESISHLSQILLAIVAIFGYFYTVRPIYQKDRLEEKVAEYEGVINSQTSKVAAMDQQIASLAEDRMHATNELAAVEKEVTEARSGLTAALGEKKRIENQMQFMDYRFHLPDGTPATSTKQVQEALDIQLKQNFVSSFSFTCGFRPDGPFFPYAFNLKDSEPTYPFSDREINAWKDQGAQTTLSTALGCLQRQATAFSSRVHDDPHQSSLVEAFTTAAISRLKAANVKPWIPPFEPTDVSGEFATKRDSINQALSEKKAAIEKQYSGWEHTWGQARRAILENNYKVSKLNADAETRSALIGLNWEYGEKANAFRKAFNNEVKRLIDEAAKI